jgi:hypothetical protein
MHTQRDGSDCNLVAIRKIDRLVHLLAVAEGAGLAAKILYHNALRLPKEPAVAPAHGLVIQEKVGFSSTADQEGRKFFSLPYWDHLPTPIQQKEEGYALGHCDLPILLTSRTLAAVSQGWRPFLLCSSHNFLVRIGLKPDGTAGPRQSFTGRRVPPAADRFFHVFPSEPQ